MSASLAYYTIFSLAPLLVIAIAIAGLVFGAQAAQNAIAQQIQGFVGPDAAKMIQTMIQSAHKPAHGLIAAVIGLVVLLGGASGVFGEIQDALNVVWDVDTKSKSGIWNLVKSRLLSYGMVLVIGFLLLVSLMVSAFLAGVFKFIGGAIPVPEILLHAVELIVSLFVIGLLFALLFKLLPDVKLSWKDVSFGAFTTAVLFTLGKFAIGIYLGKSVSSSTYGAAGSLILVISWIYYSAVILYFGAEFTHVYAAEFGSLAGQHSEKIQHRTQRENSQVAARNRPDSLPQLVEAAKPPVNARGVASFAVIPAIIRSEMQLATAELEKEARKVGIAGAMLAIGVLLAIYGVGFGLLTLFYALKIPIAAWIAAVIVTFIITTVMLALIHSGRSRLRTVHLTPQRTAASVTQDFRFVKNTLRKSQA